MESAESKYPGPTEFAHLHNHTIFSPLDGIASPEDYMKKCREFGMPAMAVTDHGQLSAFPDAYFASKKHGVKFIPGCEIYYNNYHTQLLRFQESGQKWATLKTHDLALWERMRRNRHITVLAKNMVGFRNLINMTSEAWEIGFYYKPRIWFDILSQHKEGLIILTGCINGPISYELQLMYSILRGENVDKQEAAKCWAEGEKQLLQFKEAFGDNLYFEVQMPGEDFAVSLDVFRWSLFMAEKHNVKPVLTNDCHFVDPSDFETQRSMMAIDQNLTLEDEIFGANSRDQFFKNRAQLRQTFFEQEYCKGIPQAMFEAACDNTVEVAEKCEGFAPDLEPKLPSIPDAERQLCVLVLGKLKERALDTDRQKYAMDGIEVTHKEQIEIELKRIIEKGFASYFLIMRELVQYSRDERWDVGPARGSAGGSLVCYLLGIHSLAR
jgi:DNA polymerase-3 subunit alpha